MLRRARERTDVALVRGDMRALPFRHATFALAVNLFTSFGYFLSDDEHRRVVHQVAAALAPGGYFVLDYLNAEQVRRTLEASEQAARLRGAAERRTEVRVTRRIGEDGRFVIKEIELRDEGRRFQERVRLFHADELAAMLTDAGLQVHARFGDYDGAPPTPDSPRVILIAVRP
jgi:SAM-dependent methyltransferase